MPPTFFAHCGLVHARISRPNRRTGSTHQQGRRPRLPSVNTAARPGNAARFGSAIALKAGHKNGVYCFSDEDLNHLDDILAFFGSDGIDPAFYLTSMGFTEELGTALTNAGFHQSDFKQTALYGLPSQMLSASAPGIEIERVNGNTMEVFLETVATGFEWPSEWREYAKDGLRQWSATEGFHAYLARYGGDPAGAGVLFVYEGVGFPLSWGSNSPFPRKGLPYLSIVPQTPCGARIRMPFDNRRRRLRLNQFPKPVARRTSARLH